MDRGRGECTTGGRMNTIHPVKHAEKECATCVSLFQDCATIQRGLLPWPSLPLCSLQKVGKGRERG